MECLDHIPKFFDRAERRLLRAVGLVWREIRDRRVSPVVDPSGRAIVGVELKDREQLDGGDAEFVEIGDLLNKAGVSAASSFVDARRGMTRKAAHVHFVDDRAGGGVP